MMPPPAGLLARRDRALSRWRHKTPCRPTSQALDGRIAQRGSLSRSARRKIVSLNPTSVVVSFGRRRASSRLTASRTSSIASSMLPLMSMATMSSSGRVSSMTVSTRCVLPSSTAWTTPVRPADERLLRVGDDHRHLHRRDIHGLAHVEARGCRLAQAPPVAQRGDRHARDARASSPASQGARPRRAHPACTDLPAVHGGSRAGRRRDGRGGRLTTILTLADEQHDLRRARGRPSAASAAAGGGSSAPVPSAPR